MSNKILVAGAATNAAGAFIQAYALGNATATVPAGDYFIAPTANVTIELNTRYSDHYPVSSESGSGRWRDLRIRSQHEC